MSSAGPLSSSPPDGRLPRLDAAEWLVRSETQAVFAALAARGFDARAVGGVVRNALLGRPVVDIDIATPARPQEVIDAARAAGLGAVPTGIDHGTVTVLANHVPYEITTLREDVETHGRHATVAFTEDWAADARRRDFTINALYCSAQGEVFDPLGGYPDLVARRVRFIGEPRERIREDYLRILRFFRFTADCAEGPPDPEGLAACLAEREGLGRLSAERIRQELLRLLAAARGPELIGWMFAYGLIGSVLGVAPRPGLLARLAALEAALGRAPDPILRLAALAIAIPDDADRLRERLRLSNDEHARLARTGERTDAIGPDAPLTAARRYLYIHGPAAYGDQVLLAWAFSGAGASDGAWDGRLALPQDWPPPAFPVRGADVMALGIPAGPRVGELLRALEAWWIAGDFAADEVTLRARLRELADQP